MNLPSTIVNDMAVFYDADNRVMNMSVSREPAYSTYVDNTFIMWRMNKAKNLVGVSIMEFPALWKEEDIKQDLVVNISYVFRLNMTQLQKEFNLAFL